MYMSAIESIVESNNYLRKMVHITDQHNIFLYSTIGGICGTLFYIDNPIKGFVIFAWYIIGIYLFIIFFLLYYSNE